MPKLFFPVYVAVRAITDLLVAAPTLPDFMMDCTVLINDSWLIKFEMGGRTIQQTSAVVHVLPSWA